MSALAFYLGAINALQTVVVAYIGLRQAQVKRDLDRVNGELHDLMSQVALELGRLR